MKLNHLHLNVTSPETSASFYIRWFGFRRHQTWSDRIFLRDADGFDLVLYQQPPDEAAFDQVHFGFRLPEASDVGTLYERMQAESVPIANELNVTEAMALFQCLDPDGYRVEPYWFP